MTELKEPSKRSIYLRALLFLGLTLLAGLFLVLFFFMGVFGSISTGDWNELIGGAIYFVLFIIVMSIAKKFEAAWTEFETLIGIKQRTRRETFKEIFPIFLFMSIALVFTWVIETYFLSFPTSISSELAKEMLKAILTIDGILIGFYGVVLAQLLWAIHSKGNIIYQTIIEKRNEKETLHELKKEIKRLSRTRLSVIILIFITMMPLLASILLSLNRMPLAYGIAEVSPRELLYDPISGLLTGILTLVYVMLYTNLLPSLED